MSLIGVGIPSPVFYVINTDQITHMLAVGDEYVVVLACGTRRTISQEQFDHIDILMGGIA